MSVAEAWVRAQERDIRRLNQQLTTSRHQRESLRQYNIKLENALCECVSLLVQHGIEVPALGEPVDQIIQDKFIKAIKGE